MELCIGNDDIIVFMFTFTRGYEVIITIFPLNGTLAINRCLVHAYTLSIDVADTILTISKRGVTGMTV